MARLTAADALAKWVDLGPDQYDTARFGSPEHTNRNGARVSAIYCEGPVLYNYGSHFPLAKFLGTIPGRGRGGKPTKLFVLNGDASGQSGGWGTPTARFQSMLLNSVGSAPVVSVQGIKAAGVHFADLTRDQIVDWTRPDTVSVRRHPDTGKYVYLEPGRTEAGHHTVTPIPWTPPRQGMFVPTGSVDEDGRVVGYWHVLGGALLRATDGRHLLCGVDEGRYFVSQLRRRAATVTAAFHQLKPAAVRAAEAAGLKVRRQGEWFFVPTAFTTAALAALTGLPESALLAQIRKSWPLDDDRRKDNVHRVDQFPFGGSTASKATAPPCLVRGTVTHCTRIGWTRTGEHADLKLDHVWHVPYKNTEVQSWSQAGRFD